MNNTRSFNSTNPFVESGIVLAAVTAFLYCSGTAFYEGQLALLHLDPNILDREFRQVIYSGFIQSIGFVFFMLSGYALCRIVYSHGFLPELRRSRTFKRRFLQVRKFVLGKLPKPQRLCAEKRYTRRVCLVLVVFISAFCRFYYAEKNGAREIQPLVEQIQSASLPENKLISVKIDDVDFRLFPLLCGARNCAGIEPKTLKVHYYAQASHSHVFQR